MHRRSFNKMVVAAAVATLAHKVTGANAAVDELRLIEGGGLNGDAIDAAYSKAFTAKTGINVVRESPNPFGKLRALVESKDSSVTLYELGTASLQQAKALGLLEKLDWEKIAPLPMFPEARDDYGMGYQYYSTLMCWRKGEKPLKTWADFFNPKDYPGKRALADDPVYALPAALLAAGVPIGKLFPLDVDLAFQKLEEIKSSVSVWWKAGAQPPQLLRDNEVQYANAYSGRVVGQEGIDFTYNQANLSIGYLTVVKGSPPESVEAAYKFLHETTDPANQLIAAKVLPYSGNSPDFEKLLTAEQLPSFPTTASNKQVQHFSDQAWWLDNAATVQTRWQEFALNR
ncbi:extracellular solute-binding protein [Phyllobacterium endophyticum]|uniref:ABC transporter substrate-binding protein n=1 Tax=Phyllobacterium endophyticum TaxID=1149773 RepID=A0A2P7AKB3_9HYPH|nr:extracellular solute-binding protein [Phyllobacterium endophyticum]MBB3237096.1 putative spermidine/putrescine transport system substrate-binding protein [Phyllobacterium endophyticum]PSH54668.1 hypothetical protein CU100_26195 [Phyllobacterium endophyticum]TYR40565.1 hypothetical protein FY050_16760 [Phyllobacterium endophyticum]